MQKINHMHFSLTKLSITKKTDGIFCWEGCGKRRAFIVLVGVLIGSAFLKDNLITSNETDEKFCFSVSSLEKYLHVFKETWQRVCIVALFVATKNQKQPK